MWHPAWGPGGEAPSGRVRGRSHRLMGVWGTLAPQQAFIHIFAFVFTKISNNINNKERVILWAPCLGVVPGAMN